MIVGLHHFGFAVENLEKAVELYQSMGFEIEMRFSKDTIGAKSVMVRKGKSHVELWQFSDPESELSKKISKHFAFESSNLEEDVEKFLQTGYTLSIPIDTGTVVKRYAYVEDSLGNQIELLEPLSS